MIIKIAGIALHVVKLLIYGFVFLTMYVVMQTGDLKMIGLVVCELIALIIVMGCIDNLSRIKRKREAKK